MFGHISLKGTLNYLHGYTSLVEVVDWILYEVTC